MSFLLKNCNGEPRISCIADSRVGTVSITVKGVTIMIDTEESRSLRDWLTIQRSNYILREREPSEKIQYD